MAGIVAAQQRVLKSQSEAVDLCLPDGSGGSGQSVGGAIHFVRGWRFDIQLKQGKFELQCRQMYPRFLEENIVQRWRNRSAGIGRYFVRCFVPWCRCDGNFFLRHRFVDGAVCFVR